MAKKDKDKTLEEIAAIRKKYIFDAMGFFQEYMQGCCRSGMYEWQKTFFTKISKRQGRASYAIVGSPSVGKTTMVARLFIWKLITMTSCNLTFMSMNELQTKGVGLKTFENLIKKNGLERFFVTGDRGIRTITGNEVTIARINEARQTAIRGKHCEGHAASCMIFVVDEASEAPDFIFENILPNLSQQRDAIYDCRITDEAVKTYLKENNVKSANCIEIIMTNAASGSNTDGYFFRAITDPDAGYEAITISDDEVRLPDQIDEDYWKMAESRFSGFSEQYRKCIFSKAMNNLIEADKLIEVAHRKKDDEDRHFIGTKTIMGIDVASGVGSCFTAFCIRRGHEVLYWEAKDLILRSIAEEIQKLSKEYSVNEIYYDATGFGSVLGEFVSGVNIYRFIGNSKKVIGFANMRSQVLHSMGSWLREPHTICPLTRNEISYISGLRWFVGSNSDVFFQAKKFNRRSATQEAADKVDALSYTFVDYGNPLNKSTGLAPKKRLSLQTVYGVTEERVYARVF